MISAVKENIKLILALAILAGAATMRVKEIIDIPPLFADKIIKVLSI